MFPRSLARNTERILFYFISSLKQVLLITSNSSPDQWIVPAGGVEAGEQYEAAANREILEEVSDLPIHTLSNVNL